MRQLNKSFLSSHLKDFYRVQIDEILNINITNLIKKHIHHHKFISIMSHINKLFYRHRKKKHI